MSLGDVQVELCSWTVIPDGWERYWCTNTTLNSKVVMLETICRAALRCLGLSRYEGSMLLSGSAMAYHLQCLDNEGAG